MEANLIPGEVREYFIKGSRKIKKITPNNDYTLVIAFDNGETRVYDMSRNLFGVFEVLKDIDKFKEVFIDESGNIAWDVDKNLDSAVVWNNRSKDSAYMESIPVLAKS